MTLNVRLVWAVQTYWAGVSSLMREGAISTRSSPAWAAPRKEALPVFLTSAEKTHTFCRRIRRFRLKHRLEITACCDTPRVDSLSIVDQQPKVGIPHD